MLFTLVLCKLKYKEIITFQERSQTLLSGDTMMNLIQSEPIPLHRHTISI
jgi:hypothetical protein